LRLLRGKRRTDFENNDRALAQWVTANLESKKVSMSEATTETTPETAPSEAPQPGVKMTSKAIEMVRKALEEEGIPDHSLRIAVHGGGCSGLQYALDFSDESRPGDSILEFEGLTVYVDMASMQYLQGVEVDYVTGLNGTGFKFNNPNAQRTCGCGHSFS